MNIKNQEAYALAREIAERTGLNLSGAVLVALREKRAALAARRDRQEARAETLLEYGRRLGHAGRRGTSDTGDLYDATLGLPR